MPEIKKDLLRVMKRMFEFPNSTICRHSVAQEIIQVLEKHKMLPSEQINVLAKASCDGVDGDEQALDLIQELL